MTTEKTVKKPKLSAYTRFPKTCTPFQWLLPRSHKSSFLPFLRFVIRRFVVVFSVIVVVVVVNNLF